jgi:hypothetical protein
LLFPATPSSYRPTPPTRGHHHRCSSSSLARSSTRGAPLCRACAGRCHRHLLQICQSSSPSEEEPQTELSVNRRPSAVRLCPRWNTGHIQQFARTSKHLKGSATWRRSHTVASPVPSRRRCVATSLEHEHPLEPSLPTSITTVHTELAAVIRRRGQVRPTAQHPVVFCLLSPCCHALAKIAATVVVRQD